MQGQAQSISTPILCSKKSQTIAIIYDKTRSLSVKVTYSIANTEDIQGKPFNI